MILKEIQEDVPYQELKGAYHLLQKTNKDLVDGLYYAAFVQQGLLPQERHFEKLKHPYFIYYSPLQIIGGDFFWTGRKDDWSIYAVGDCTGHGVSGAMLSTLAIGFLNYIVYSRPFTEAGQILSELDKKWIETFNHQEEIWNDNDWMDLSIIAENKQMGVLQFAGARGEALLHTDANELRRIKGERYPVGGWQLEENRVYSTQTFALQGLLNVFLYSDGFKDQAGDNGKKLGSKQFAELIASSACLSCQEQKERLVAELRRWQGCAGQTDDICLMRVQLSSSSPLNFFSDRLKGDLTRQH